VEFGWSNTDYANIAAAFQFVYAISMLFAGRVVDKIGTKAAYVVAITVWSLGALLHAASVPVGEAAAAVLGVFGVAAVPSIVGFMISRAVLAVGEAGNFPAAIKATAEYFPKKNAPSPPASSTPAPTSAPSWRRSRCRCWPRSGAGKRPSS
jgi:ACS family hexuronate transporter-like MFS transporter